MRLRSEVEVCPKAKAALIIIVSLFIATASIFAREDEMRKLPVYRNYRCAICHRSSDPISGLDLNAFGIDYKNNGSVWNAALAGKDSDNDGFRNGIELGDEDGDGTAEVSAERSNPGDPLNTPNSVDRATWGLIKSLFDSR